MDIDSLEQLRTHLENRRLSLQKDIKEIDNQLVKIENILNSNTKQENELENINKDILFCHMILRPDQIQKMYNYVKDCDSICFLKQCLTKDDQTISIVQNNQEYFID